VAQIMAVVGGDALPPAVTVSQTSRYHLLWMLPVASLAMLIARPALGLSLVAYIILAIVAGLIARNRGRSGIGFFLLALILTPLVGIIAAVVKPDLKNIEKAQLASGRNKKCPYCAEIIKSEANVCRFCRRELSTPEVAQ